MKYVNGTWAFVAASFVIASGVWAQEPTNSTAEATSSLGVDGRQMQGVGAEGQRPPAQLPSEASTGEERSSAPGRSTELRRATGFTEDERQAMRERRQFMSEEERAAARERAAQRRSAQGANNGQFPGGGHTGGVFPGRGETGGVFPGGGPQGEAFPGRGQTGGAFPGSGQTGGAFPGGHRAPGGMPQRGTPRGGKGR